MIQLETTADLTRLVKLRLKHQFGKHEFTTDGAPPSDVNVGLENPHEY
jgi:hypothetical protein